MIEESQYKFPRKQEQQKPIDVDKKKVADNLDYLESLPFRPFSEEW